MPTGINLTNEVIDERIIKLKLPLKRIENFKLSTISINWKCLRKLENGIECGYVWKAKTYNIFNNRGCPECRKITMKEKLSKYDNYFVDKKLKELNKNIIRKDDIHNVKQKILWECQKCNYNWRTNCDGVFNKNTGCPKCVQVMRLTNNIIDERLKEFDMTIMRMEDVKNSKIKIKWFCNVCKNIFLMNPDSIFNKKCGCTVCNEPHGEKEIRRLLKKYNLIFEEQKKLEGCKNIRHLRFDFCIYNTDRTIRFLIEYQGNDHYPPTDKMKKYKPSRWNEQRFEYNSFRDKIKKDYCNNNNIKLIEIPYWDINNIEEIIKINI